jgi:hypothetical protein
METSKSKRQIESLNTTDEADEIELTDRQIKYYYIN